ncbi:MAG TPA: tetratricopeptide repeat protein [Bacteroidia bacterium]|jgi:Flp pilus assembly protein TadD|nr:tetratricopeptide repeat protein [Bacteroidia bacterium]HQF28110.1 tetratricopeptide repeat protein [Bacteroidia bacterium]
MKKATRKEKFNKPEGTPKSMKIKKEEGFEKYYIWIVAALSFLIYANTLKFGYALDDYAAILENKSTMKGWAAIGEIFKTSYRYGYIFVADDLYRPLTKSVFAIQWALSPNKPFLCHLTNVIVFMLTCVFSYRFLVDILKGDKSIAFVVSILFASMPIHTEVVSNIKSLDELMGMMFGVLAMHSFYRYASLNSTLQLIKGSIFFLLAMLSKESSITLLAVFPLVVYFFSEKNIKELIAPTGAAAVAAVLFLMMRQNAIGFNQFSLPPSFTDNMLMAAPDVITKYTTAIFLLGRYLLKMILPLGLTFDLSYPSIPFAGISDIGFIISAIVLTGMLVIALMQFKSRNVISFALLFFFITASVSSNIFVIIGTHWGERLMYLPSWGISFALVLGVAYLIEKYSSMNKKSLAMIFALPVVIYSGMSIARNPVWESNESLYRSGLISAPNSTRVQYYMGNFLIKEDVLAGKTPQQQDQILKEGISYLKRSVELNPTFTDAWNQMGLAYFRLKDNTAAKEAFYKGIETNKNEPTIYNNLGNVLFGEKDYAGCIQLFQKAVALNPNYSEAWANMGSAYGMMGNYDMAIPNFEKAIAADPNNQLANYFLGVTWRNKGNEMLAKQYLDRAEQLKAAKEAMK